MKKSFCSLKVIVKRIKRQFSMAHNKIFTKDISNVRFVSWKYKETSILNNRKKPNKKWTKGLADHWKKYMGREYAYEKMLNIMLLGNCKLKQWDATTHLLECPKPHFDTPNAGKEVA